jgi:predicted dithiol-disulfide oxidoreductase (DUF899 family)
MASHKAVSQKEWLAARQAHLVNEQALPDQLEAYKKRMGWSFKWVSSHDEYGK